MNFSEDVLKLNPELSQSLHVEYRTKPERILKLDDGFHSDLERDYYVELVARGLSVQRCNFGGGWTFHLPGGVDYTPDFIAWGNSGLVRVIECKGSMHQKNARDSRTRFKIAAGLYPFTFVWVTRSLAGEWIEKIIFSGTQGA